MLEISEGDIWGKLPNLQNVQPTEQTINQKKKILTMIELNSYQWPWSCKRLWLWQKKVVAFSRKNFKSRVILLLQWRNITCSIRWSETSGDPATYAY